MYKINPTVFSGVFAVPTIITDKYLLLATAQQLKVILYMLRCSFKPLSAEEISLNTGIKEAEVADTLLYWEQEGIIVKKDSSEYFDFEQNNVSEKTPTAEITQKTAPDNMPEEKKQLQKIDPKPQKPSYEVICKRLLESDDVKTLFNEAQMKLGRTLGTGDQGTLLLLYDYYGLPIEIILLICEYSRTHASTGNKSNMAYIFKIGEDWSKREIFTMEAADEELKSLEFISVYWNELCRLTGISAKYPTGEQNNLLKNWINNMKLSVALIATAYEEACNNSAKNKFTYMNKILFSWKEKNISTPEQAEEYLKQHDYELQQAALAAKENKSAKKSEKNTSKPVNASYDIEKAEQKAKTSVPTLKKKEKR